MTDAQEPDALHVLASYKKPSFDNPSGDETIGQGIDRINARYFDEAGNRVSGLRLEEIGLSGHGVANTLWKISAYLERRADGERE